MDRLSENGQPKARSSANSGHVILLIDDNPAVASAMEIAFRMAGHALDIAKGPEESFSLLARRHYDAIVLDLNFTAGKADGCEGLACLERIVADDPATCVVVLTAHGGIRTAVAAMQAGARDFAVKPWKNADLIAKVEAAISRSSPAPAPAPTPAAFKLDSPLPRLLGESEAIEAVRDLVRRIGPTSAGVAITGPSGAGRTLTAMMLHAVSPYAAIPPLRVDLRDAAAWEALADARGTVILRHPDRLDDLEQDRLSESLPSMIRPIAIADSVAPLTPAVRRRIATVELAVPPLADRRADIPLLARHFLHAAAERFGRPPPTLTESAEAAIRAADWPDQVRGLALAMERAVLLADGELVDSSALFLGDSIKPAEAREPQEARHNFDLHQSERVMIEAALREHHHNISHAAKALGLSRGALYRRMERHGL